MMSSLAGMEVELFEGIEPDPSVETVMKGAAAMEKFKPDWIVAIGGGSPIDAAKAMWIKYEYPDITFEDMCKVFGIPKLRKKAHFCAISSTSGTATEVTAFSIITDYEKGIKYPIADFEITPDVAIVDPELAETMPQKLVALGYDWFEKFCMKFNTSIVVVNNEELSPQEELVQDIVSILHDFSCRLYGLRKYKKTNRRGCGNCERASKRK